MGLFATALLFLSPILYPLSAVPEPYRSLLLLNPITHVVVESRNLLMAGQWPELWPLVVYWLIALTVCWLGYAWFQKTRGGFADVL
jgi:lipopolysaccharide transport system permease protein